MSIKKAKRPGRPRDEETRLRILETAVDLLSKQGYRTTTMNAIAHKSGSGKQTLYRWWKNRAELLMDALLHNAQTHVDTVIGAREDHSVDQFLKTTFSLINAGCGEILRSLIAEGIADKKMFQTLFASFISKRQDALRELLRKRARKADFDDETADILIDIIFGAMWYRIIFRHRPLNDRFAERLAGIVIQQ